MCRRSQWLCSNAHFLCKRAVTAEPPASFGDHEQANTACSRNRSTMQYLTRSTHSNVARIGLHTCIEMCHRKESACFLLTSIYDHAILTFSTMCFLKPRVSALLNRSKPIRCSTLSRSNGSHIVGHCGPSQSSSFALRALAVVSRHERYKRLDIAQAS